MSHYRCFFVNMQDKFDGYQLVEAETDAYALERARNVLVHHPYAAAVEVWCLGKMVGRVDRDCGRSEQK